MRAIHVAGTADTKAEEIAYLRDLIVAGGARAVLGGGDRGAAVAATRCG